MTTTSLTFRTAAIPALRRRVAWSEDDAYAFGCALGRIVSERQPIALPATASEVSR